jgi:aspartate/glutamate racemase
MHKVADAIAARCQVPFLHIADGAIPVAGGLTGFDVVKIDAVQHQAGGVQPAQSRLAVGLQQAGAEGIVLCTNTMHKVADAIAARCQVPRRTDRLRCRENRRCAAPGWRSAARPVAPSRLH